MRSISPFERYSVPVPLEEANLQTHIFVEGDTLSAIAHKHYDDWRLWKEIAEYNAITDPRRISPGTRLLIPLRPLEQGAFESN